MGGGHRALVFSQFTRFLRIARTRLEAAGVECCYLDGTTTNRPAVISSFKDGTAPFGYPVLILSVLDAWLPTVHKGYWGLIAGVVVAIGAFQTARTRQCPINGLLGVNTAQGTA